MKTARLTLMWIGLAVFAQARVCAAHGSPSSATNAPSAASTAVEDVKAASPVNDTRQQVKAGRFYDQGDRREVSSEIHAVKHSGPAKANVAHGMPRRQRPMARDVMTDHPSFSISSRSANTGESLQAKGAIRNLSVPQPSGTRSTVLPLIGVRHHSPNAAIIGGTASSNTKYAGILSGTRMNRKP